MLKAGELEITFAPPGVSKTGKYVVTSQAKSLGAASAIYPYQHSHWAELEPKSFRSTYFRSDEKDHEESIQTTNRYQQNSVSSEETTVNNQSKKVANRAQKFPHGPARDLFSAILYIRSQKLAVGEEHTLLLLPFFSPYLLHVRSEAHEKHQGREAIRLKFSLRKIDNKTYALKPYKKLKRPVTVWFTNDADRIPLEIRADVFIGDVRAVLSSYKKH